MGGKQEINSGTNDSRVKHSENQVVKKRRRDVGDKLFGGMDKAVRAEARRERMERSLEEFEEMKLLAEEQRRRYYNGKLLRNEEPGEASRTVEQPKEDVPRGIIDKSPESIQESQKGSLIKISLAAKILAVLPKAFGGGREVG